MSMTMEEIASVYGVPCPTVAQGSHPIDLEKTLCEDVIAPALQRMAREMEVSS